MNICVYVCMLLFTYTTGNTQKGRENNNLVVARAMICVRILNSNPG